MKTLRLDIRRFRADDWKAMQEIWAKIEQTEYASYDRPKDLSDDAVRERIERWAQCAESSEHMFFAVCLEEKLIGCVAFNVRENGYETGYSFHPEYHRKGYAKESIAALLEELKAQRISRITAGTALKNTPSVKLLHSLGFTQISTEKISFYRDEKGNEVFFDGGTFELGM